MPTLTLPFFQVDAFTHRQFSGNPAAVCPLKDWLPDDLMQRIASENNLSETAFFVKNGEHYDIRWFSPACEIALCGHATLASAFVITQHLQPGLAEIRFQSQSGPLTVAVEGERFVLDFPAYSLKPCTKEQWPFTSVKSEEYLYGRGDGSGAYVAVLQNTAAVKNFSPDFADLERMRSDLIVTAKGHDVDFVSRLFAPWAGIPEDPVTGSAHCLLVPFWAARLGKSKLSARQESQRSGELFCEHRGNRVSIGGHAVLVIKGEMQIH